MRRGFAHLLPRGLPSLGLVLAMALVLGGCGEPDVIAAPPKVEVDQQKLEFGVALVGGKASRSLVVRNLGQARASVRVEIAPPFSVETESFSVPGGGARTLGIAFSPQEVGSVVGVATHHWLEEPITVELVGEGVEAGVCKPSTDCREIRFDPVAGCLEDWRPDGTPCEDPCLVDGVCNQGRCVGEGKDCSDGDPCTYDFCDSALGCQNVVDPARACGDPDDPCKVASCDPEGGCAVEHIADGTACGPATCGKSWVCISGECVDRDTPNQGKCGEETPCRAAGVCVDGVCVQPAPVKIPLFWSEAPPVGWSLHFDGVSDEVGRLYWVECAANVCLLAVGHPAVGKSTRFPMFQDSAVAPGRLMLTMGVIVSSFRQGWIEFFDAEDGVRRGGVELRKVFGKEVGRIEVSELAAHSDRVFALVEAWDEDRFVEGLAIAMTASGEVEWTRSLGGSFDGIVIDEWGRLILTVVYQVPSAHAGALVSFSSEGTERWRLPVETNAPLAVANGRFLDGSGTIRRVEDGVVDQELMCKVPLFSGSAILGLDFGHVFGYPLEPCPHTMGLCPTWVPHLCGFDPSGVKDSLRPVDAVEGWDRTEPIYTEERRLVFAAARPDGKQGCQRTFFITEVSEEVHGPGFSCELPGSQKGYSGPTTLHEGIWAVANDCENRLEAYRLGERTTAPHGWVTSRGDLGRRGTPR